jgi:hypothetical protein
LIDNILSDPTRTLLEAYVEPLPGHVDGDLESPQLLTKKGYWQRGDCQFATMNWDTVWNLYKKANQFDLVASKTGMVPKSKNTIVEEWPERLKLVDEPLIDGRASAIAQREFDCLTAMFRDGDTRVVEWQKVDVELSWSEVEEWADHPQSVYFPHGQDCY